MGDRWCRSVLPVAQGANRVAPCSSREGICDQAKVIRLLACAKGFVTREAFQNLHEKDRLLHEASKFVLKKSP